MREARILFLAAAPSCSPLWLEMEVRLAGLRTTRRRSGMPLTARTRQVARLDDLERALMQEGPAVLHFVGNGAEGAGLMFEDEPGRATMASGAALQNVLSTFRDEIRVVLLDGCFCEHQAEAIGKVVDCVIGVSRSGNGRSAQEFAAAFYRALGDRLDVQTAFELGLRAVQHPPEDEDGVPRLLVGTAETASSVFLSRGEADRLVTGARARTAGPGYPVRASMAPVLVDMDVKHLVSSGKDTAAWSLIVQRYLQPVHRYCCDALRDPVLAEEVHRHVFLEAHRALRELRGTTTVSKWIFDIAHRLVMASEAQAGTSLLDGADVDDECG